MSVTEVTPYEIPWQESLNVSWEGGHPVLRASSENRHPDVGGLLPTGYDAYVRLFHPFVSQTAVSAHKPLAPAASWAELADRAGVAFGPTLTLRQLRPALAGLPDLFVDEGYLEEFAASALFDVLDDDQGGPWLFAFGLAGWVIAGRPRLFSATSLDDRLTVAELSEVGDAGSPEYVWPADQRWIVCTGRDLTSTYLAVPQNVAERLLTHPTLEAIEVRPETRVDDRADESGLST